MKKIILHSSGDDFKRIFCDLTWEKIFNKKSVAYVIVASEGTEGILKNAIDDFADKEAFLKKLGVTKVQLITSQNFDDFINYETVILANGDTAVLMDKLGALNFKKKVLKSKIENLVGIGSGAIALSTQGIGTKNYVEFSYNGFGLVDEKIIINFKNNRPNLYNGFTKLMDYQYMSREPIARYTEIGWDWTNNKFGLGVSSKIEFDNETAKRYVGFLNIKVKCFFIFIWILKYSVYLGTNGIKFKKKDKNNFKIVFGWGGK